jgi:type II secretory ATPase GspE/PulE/Tfp pilus assembly ATPase PilB-like protein
VEEGMQTMLHDGILKAAAGLTSIEEVFRVVS